VIFHFSLAALTLKFLLLQSAHPSLSSLFLFYAACRFFKYREALNDACKVKNKNKNIRVDKKVIPERDAAGGKDAIRIQEGISDCGASASLSDARTGRNEVSGSGEVMATQVVGFGGVLRG